MYLCARCQAGLARSHPNSHLRNLAKRTLPLHDVRPTIRCLAEIILNTAHTLQVEPGLNRRAGWPTLSRVLILGMVARLATLPRDSADMGRGREVAWGDPG